MYCQKCGIELADSEEKCPLCQTAVYHPDIERKVGEPTYPKGEYPQQNAKKVIGLIVVTTLYFLAFFTCMLCDIQVFSKITWSGYAMGAILCSYGVLILPHWFKRKSALVFIPVDFALICAFLAYINHVVNGEWFLGFAFPLCAGIGTVVFLVVALLQRLRKKGLYIFAGAFFFVAGMMYPLELSINETVGSVNFYFWSLYPIFAFSAIGIMLLVLAAYRPAREALERRFFI